MAVDLEDLVEDFQAEITPLGGTIVGTTAQAAARLKNAFWEARLQGAFANFREEDGSIVPITGTEDMPREHQQLLIIFAALNVALAKFQNAQSAFRAKAGPVEYETQQSATLMRAVLDALRQKLGTALSVVLDGVGNTAVFDAVISRTEAIAYGDVWNVR